MYRWIGAVLIIGSCGSCGLSITLNQLREERMVKELLRFLEHIRWELEYRMTPLPELILSASCETHGVLHCVMMDFRENLQNLTLPDAGSCMRLALTQELPQEVEQLLRLLGDSLGRYDLPGQLEGLRAVEASCHDRGEVLRQERTAKGQSCRLLGFCTGIALAVLLV